MSKVRGLIHILALYCFGLVRPCVRPFQIKLNFKDGFLIKIIICPYFLIWISSLCVVTLLLKGHNEIL